MGQGTAASRPRSTGTDFERIGISPETIEPGVFEQLVFWWLNDLARSVPADVDARLRQSGIVDVVAGGHVLNQLAA